MSTTYEPKAKTKYFIDQNDVERWVSEQYGIQGFNVPSDLQEYASPEGSYTVSADGEISDYRKEEFEEWLEEAQSKELGKYESLSSRLMTDPLMNKLADDGHIPKGEYVISISY